MGYEIEGEVNVEDDTSHLRCRYTPTSLLFLGDADLSPDALVSRRLYIVACDWMSACK